MKAIATFLVLSLIWLSGLFAFAARVQQSTPAAPPGATTGGVYSPRPTATPQPLPPSLDPPRERLRIVTLPDGRQVVERTVNDPLGGR